MGRSRIAPALVLGVAALVLNACVERSIEVKLDSGLKMHDVKLGRGLEAQEGYAVEISYRAALEDGKVIIDTYRDNKTHKFHVGDGTVITGLDEAIRGMKPGGKRVVLLPATSHYGTRGYGNVVPPESTLRFEVEMVEVRTRWY